MNDINNSQLTYTEKIKRILENNDKYNLTKLNNEINSRNDTSTSLANLSKRLNNMTLRYEEVEQILDILGYDIVWTKRTSPRVIVKRGENIEYDSCPEKKISNMSTLTLIDDLELHFHPLFKKIISDQVNELLSIYGEYEDEEDK